MVRRSAINRRDFLKRTSVAAGIGALGVPVRSAAAAQRGVALIIDPRDPVAASAPAGWAAEELCQALAARQIAVEMASSLDQARAAATRIRIAGIASPAAQDLLRRAGTTVAAVSEALALVPSTDADGAILLAAGAGRDSVQRAPGGGWREDSCPCMQARCRGHRIEAPGAPVPGRARPGSRPRIRRRRVCCVSGISREPRSRPSHCCALFCRLRQARSQCGRARVVRPGRSELSNVGDRGRPTVRA
jgi:hypothetical protein